MKLFKSILALSITAFFAGCLGDSYVELSAEDKNNPLFKKGVELIKAKNNGDNLEFYDPRSLKNAKNVHPQSYSFWLQQEFTPMHNVLDEKDYYKKLVFTINKSKDDKPELYSIICFKYKAENCDIDKSSVN